MRERLPGTRFGWTHKGEILGAPEVCPHCGGTVRDARTKLFVTCNYFEDGRPAEVFVTCDQSGGTLDGFADVFSTLLSLLWQWGMCFAETFKKLGFVEFEPKGLTRHEDIKMARSLVDYVMQLVRVETERREKYEGGEESCTRT